MIQEPIQQPATPQNGAAMAPLASVEDVTDSPPTTSEPTAASTRSPSHHRDNPLLLRFRQWTDRFSLNPLRSASLESPGSGTLESGQSTSSPKSPRPGSRKVSHNLSRLFSRSCSRGADKSPCSSPEPNQRPSSTSGTGASGRPSRATEISRKMSNSLDNLQTSGSTNHPSGTNA